MAALSKLLGMLATSHDVSRIGAASYAGLAAVISHVASRSSSIPAAGSRTSQDETCDPNRIAFMCPPPLAATTPDLHGHLPDDGQIIVLSNREPCIHELTATGDILACRPASGLVTALEPVVKACNGVWVAHGSGSADRLTTDRDGHVEVQDGDSSYSLRRVWLSADEERGYYYGFANEGLWPLCHLAFSSPIFRRSDWSEYQRVNRRFADVVAAEIHTKQPIVLVQDYHFALVPRLLRRRRPDAIVVTFWHIPWPNADQFSVCPYGRELVDGLLGSNILGFQTAAHCRNFLNSVEATSNRSIDRESNAVRHRDNVVRVRPYPISVEWPNRWTSQAPPIVECRRTVRAECELDEACSLVVSVDRLDYTKGFEERFAAIERLFEMSGAARQPVAFLQIAAPTRVAIQRYGELAARVRGHIARINERFGDGRFTPVTYVERYTEPADIFRCYRAADVCYVSSLDDGMNLVAKEFVAARDDERGILVLSRFAGAARELADALIVNPYDVDGVAEALSRALNSTIGEQQTRMRRMRRWIAGHNVYDWARAMLADAAQLRQHDTASGTKLRSVDSLVSANIM